MPSVKIEMTKTDIDRYEAGLIICPVQTAVNRHFAPYKVVWVAGSSFDVHTPWGVQPWHLCRTGRTLINGLRDYESVWDTQGFYELVHALRMGWHELDLKPTTFFIDF